MMSPAYDIAQQIDANGLLTLAQNLFVGEEPVSPIDVSTIYDTGGQGSRLSIQGNTPTIQVRTRSKQYLTGYNLQHQIKAVLESMTNFNQGQFFYNFIALQSDIGKIGVDQNGNHIFTSNYRIERKTP